MPVPGSERTLRRLVAKLAELQAEDADAILAELESDQRRTVERLLADYQTPPTRPDTTATVAAGIEIDDLSPWLAARLGGPAASAGASGMTLKTLTTLREAATAMLKSGEARPAPREMAPVSLSLLDRLRGASFGRFFE